MHRVLTLMLLSAAASQAASVYAITTNQQFSTLDLDTGPFARIGPDLPEESSGLVPGPNGTFLSLGFSGTLNSINATTGVTTALGSTGLGNCSGRDRRVRRMQLFS